MRENYGTMPGDARDKRIRGVLRNGRRFGFEAVNAGQQPGWAADTTRWPLDGSPFDVLEFEVIS